MTFKGRTGVLIWITAAVLAACEVLFFLFKEEFNPILFWILVIGFGLILIITLMFEFRNKIVVTKDLVKICFGITTTKVGVSTITSVKKTVSAIASDSASLRRIEIGYANEKGIRTVFCATRREEEFIKLLTEYNPKIKVF